MIKFKSSLEKLKTCELNCGKMYSRHLSKLNQLKLEKNGKNGKREDLRCEMGVKTGVKS